MTALFATAVDGQPAPFTWWYSDTGGIYAENNSPVWQGFNKTVDDYFFFPNGDEVRLLFKSAGSGWQMTAQFYHAAINYGGEIRMSFSCFQDRTYVSTDGDALIVDSWRYENAGGVAGVCVKSPGSTGTCLANDGTGSLVEFFGQFSAVYSENAPAWQYEHTMKIAFTDSRWYLRTQNPLP